jgi:serine/threonine-protein kinase
LVAPRLYTIAAVTDESDPWRDAFGDALRAGDVLQDKYRVERIIGTGGMAVVLEAAHTVFEQRVAIKLLRRSLTADEEAVARFDREARASFRIKSEHVAKVYDVSRLANGTPYIVMEYLEGRDLGNLLGDQKGIPAVQAVDYVLQACEAIAEAHTLGIVHRDLKPDNLFLGQAPDGSPCVKVLDFGVSKMSEKNRRGRALTGAMVSLGTPQYMSPEQWASARDVGPGTDIWALGVILYELIRGVAPFDHPLFARLCSMILTEPAPSLASIPGVDPGLDLVVQRCLEKQASARYVDVCELANALAPFASESGRASVARVARIFERARSDSGEQQPVRPTAKMDASDAPTQPRVSTEVSAPMSTAVSVNSVDTSSSDLLIASPRRSRGWIIVGAGGFAVACVAAWYGWNTRHADGGSASAATTVESTASPDASATPPATSSASVAAAASTATNAIKTVPSSAFPRPNSYKPAPSHQPPPTKTRGKGKAWQTMDKPSKPK